MTTPLFRQKPGTDWPAIRVRYEAGESPSAIARDLAGSPGAVVRQAIEKRAKKEGWRIKRTAMVRLPPVKTIPPPRSPEALDLILEGVLCGITIKAATARAGSTPDALRHWMKDDPEIARLIEKARADFQFDNMQAIAAARELNDWKAAAYLLEKSEATSDVYGKDPNQGGGPSLWVQLNVLNAGDPPGATAHLVNMRTGERTCIDAEGQPIPDTPEDRAARVTDHLRQIGIPEPPPRIEEPEPEPDATIVLEPQSPPPPPPPPADPGLTAFARQLRTTESIALQIMNGKAPYRAPTQRDTAAYPERVDRDRWRQEIADRRRRQP